MSCFMMGTRELSAIASSLAALLNQSGMELAGLSAPASLSEVLYDCSDMVPGYPIYDERMIFRTLYRLNQKAYHGRYPTDDTPEPEDDALLDAFIPGLSLIYRTEYSGGPNGHYIVTPKHYRLSMLLSCYSYQIMEDATWDHPMRKAIAKTNQRLRNWIVHNSPEYASMTWGSLEN